MSLRLNQILGGADIRSPIFYDSNDTNYYIDAASTSLLNATRSVSVVAGSNSAMTGSPGSLAVYSASSPYISFHDGGVARTAYFQEAGGRFYFGDVTYTESEGSFRAPLFYDVNDTTYYTDPASFSLISSLGIGGLTSSNNVQMYDSYVDASSSYLQSPPLIIRKDSSATGAIDQAPVGLFIYNLNGTNNTWTKFSMGSREAAGAGNTVSIAGLAAQKTAGTANSWATGNLHFWTKAGATQITNMVAYSAGYVQSDYSFRSPIFYDSNDTTYYIDAASTSQLNQVASYYLRNLAAVSTDHQFGLYFNNSIDTAYAIYREGGAWTNPYPDLRIAFHTGIKIGANAGYNGVRFYDDYGMANQVMSVNNSGDGLGANNVYVNNSLQAGSSLRAPIFYDSNDTTYYTDPASTSNILELKTNRTWYDSSASVWGGGINMAGNNPSIGFQSTSSTWWYMLHHASSNINFYRRSTSGSWNHDGIWDNSGNLIWQGSSVRGQIFYDNNDTTYYVDPASSTISSYLKASQFVGNYKIFTINDLSASGAQARTFEIARLGIDYNDWNTVGTFEVELHEKYWSQGLKKVYNIWYGYVSNSGIKLVEWRGAGTNNFQCRIGTQVQISGDSYYLPVYVDVRNYGIVDVVIKTNRNYTTNSSPAIGYSYINTAPSATNISDFTADSDLEISTLNNAKLNGNPILSSYNYTNYTLPIGGSWYGVNLPGTRWNGMTVNGGEIVFGRDLPNNGQMGILVDGCYIAGENNGFWSLSSSNDWTTRRGMYWDGTYLNFTTNSAISIFTDARSTIFYDSNNTVYYCDPASTSNLNAITAAGNITAAQYYTGGWFRNNGSGNGLYNESTGQHFYSDSANYWNVASSAGAQGIRLRTGGHNGTVRGYFYADTNNDVGFLNQDGSWRLRVVGGDYALADGSSMRAQIFYDSNDTNYYVDPAGTSYLNYSIFNGLSSADYTRQFAPSGGYFYAGGAQTGAIKIRMPANSKALYPMLSFTCHIYNYSTGTSRTFKIGGHFSNSSWYNPFAYCLSESAGNLNVRWGYEGNYLVVWIGETSSGWSYPCVFITDFQNGYSAINNSWMTGWNVSLVTAFDTVTNGPTAAGFFWNQNNDGSGSGLDADLVDGLDVHTGRNDNANKIVRTDSNGYIQAGWINTTSGDNGTTAIDRIYASSDAYIRYYTPANFRTVLDVPTRAGSGASGSWGISITGSSASCTGNSATATTASSCSGNSATATTATNAGCVTSDTGNVGDSRLQYWQTSGNTTLNPDTEWYNAIRMGHGNPVTYYSNTLAVKMTGSNLGDIYTRTTTNGTAGTWNRFWNNNNDGAGSGLDADLLDGINSASFLRSDVSATNSVDLRSPIFYDSNNTAYYVDPSSTSNLVGLTVANTITGAVSGNAGSVTINYNNDSNSTYQMLWGSGNNVYGTAGVYLNPSTDYVTATSFNASDWFRSSGATGWYNSTYGGGIYMTDTTWVRTYNSKYFYCDTIIQAGSDMRSPVYYDANDTAYYVDAASTSNLLLVKTRNTFGERVAVSATASTTINTQYNVTELTLAATITTLTLSNIQASGTVHMWTIVTVGGGVGYSITWPAAVKWPGGTAPTLTTTSNKRDIYQFVTYDGGTTIFAIIVGQNL